MALTSCCCCAKVNTDVNNAGSEASLREVGAGGSTLPLSALQGARSVLGLCNRENGNKTLVAREPQPGIFNV